MTITAAMIDSREPEWVQKLQFGGVMTTVTVLEFGDFWATTTDGSLVCVERKTPTDFLGSLKDNRVMIQAAGIKRLTPWAYLVITGMMTPSVDGSVIAEGRVTGWKWESVQGGLLSIQELGVNVIYCANDKDYESTVLRICNRERSKEKILEPHVMPRIMSPAEVMLTSLPGIGIDRAQLLLREFDNNAAWALAWLTQLNTVDPVAGIGNGIKKSVRLALNLRDKEEMIVQGNKYVGGN